MVRKLKRPSIGLLLLPRDTDIRVAAAKMPGAIGLALALLSSSGGVIARPKVPPFQFFGHAESSSTPN